MSEFQSLANSRRQKGRGCAILWIKFFSDSFVVWEKLFYYSIGWLKICSTEITSVISLNTFLMCHWFDSRSCTYYTRPQFPYHSYKLCLFESFACDNYCKDRRGLNMALYCLFPGEPFFLRWQSVFPMVIWRLLKVLFKRVFDMLTLSYHWLQLLIYTYSFGSDDFTRLCMSRTVFPFTFIV